MKIEFCCEEMRKAIIVGNAAVDWRYEGKAEKVVRIRDTCADYPGAYLTTCPYCDAKIKISVKEHRLTKAQYQKLQFVLGKVDLEIIGKEEQLEDLKIEIAEAKKAYAEGMKRLAEYEAAHKGKK